MRTFWQMENEYLINWKIIMADENQLWWNVQLNILLRIDLQKLKMLKFDALKLRLKKIIQNI